MDTASSRPGMRKLMDWWLRGVGAAKIRWGQPGDFNRCVRMAEKYMGPNEAKGFCSNLHEHATGARPGHAASERKK